MIVANAWATYAADVVPLDASPVQLQETQQAFYAGAAAVFGGMCRAVGRDTNDPTDAEIATFENIEAELLAFAKTIGVGVG